MLLVLVMALMLGTSALASAGTNATLCVIRGINGVDLGAPMALPVDISVNGACALKGFEFKQIAGPLSLSASTYDSKISLANTGNPCGNSPVISAMLPLSAGKNYTAIAYLTDTGAPSAGLFENNTSNPGSGRARIIAHHTAWAPPVDLALRRGDDSKKGDDEHGNKGDDQHGYASAKSNRVGPLANGQMWQGAVRPGNWLASVFLAGTNTRVLGPLALHLKSQKAYSYYVVGSAKNGLFVISPTFSAH
jgi:hypothetical protein